jgi:FkbM family methyltransferase
MSANALSIRLSRARARRREGLSLAWQILNLAGVGPHPRFAGVRLSAPDEVTGRIVIDQVSRGEYRWPGVTPEAGWRVVDVGANIGVFSLWAERLGATVVAFEPAPLTYHALTVNVAGKRVETVQAAVVGSGRTEVRLYLSEGSSTRHSMVGRELDSGLPLTEFVDVPAVGLEDAVAAGCDLLKLDCEGAEFECVLGARDETLRAAKRLIIEFHRAAGDPGQLMDRLRDAGMSPRLLSDSGAVGLLAASVARPST